MSVAPEDLLQAYGYVRIELFGHHAGEFGLQVLVLTAIARVLFSYATFAERVVKESHVGSLLCEPAVAARYPGEVRLLESQTQCL